MYGIIPLTPPQLISTGIISALLFFFSFDLPLFICRLFFHGPLVSVIVFFTVWVGLFAVLLFPLPSYPNWARTAIVDHGA